MEYMDNELLEEKRKLEHQKHTTLETGIYAGENLITFTRWKLPDYEVYLPLPDQFVVMPDEVKSIKYPSKAAPEYIFTSLDSMVNICLNIIPLVLETGELEDMSNQFQNALKNINPSIMIKNQTVTKTEQGNDMTWFEYKGYHLDGQSYNRVYLVRLRKVVFYGTFSCEEKDRKKWSDIVELIFLSIKEYL